jgi:hypothetical protein
VLYQTFQRCRGPQPESWPATGPMLEVTGPLRPNPRASMLGSHGRHPGDPLDAGVADVRRKKLERTGTRADSLRMSRGAVH